MIRFNVKNEGEVKFTIPGQRVNYDINEPIRNYNLLDGKPQINGVTLEGNVASDDLGVAAAPLIGPITDITPAMALTALQAGRMVLLETSIEIGDFEVPIVFLATLIADAMVGGTQVVSYIDGTDTIRAMQLVGVSGSGWQYREVNLARETSIPDPGTGTPEMDQEQGSAGEQRTFARFDHIHPSDTSKQDLLTAGDNIDIDNHNVISVTGTVPNALMTGAIPYGQVDLTSTSTAFTATIPGITELRSGTCVLLRNSVVNSAAGFTIDINGLGAKPVYSNMGETTTESTIFSASYTMLFIFDEERTTGGGWICYRGYDSNTNTIGYQIRTNSMSLPMDSITYRYRLLFRSVDGTKFVPANNSTSPNATAKRTTIDTPIDPFGDIVYYGTTASVAAGSRPGAAYLWQQYGITLGYSFNRTGAALTLTSWKPVYIKALPQASGGAVIDAETPYVQDLPTTNDGYIYIYLGVAYSATSVELELNHPVYYHDGTRIRLWT